MHLCYLQSTEPLSILKNSFSLLPKDKFFFQHESINLQMINAAYPFPKQATFNDLERKEENV